MEKGRRLRGNRFSFRKVRRTLRRRRIAHQFFEHPTGLTEPRAGEELHSNSSSSRKSEGLEGEWYVRTTRNPGNSFRMFMSGKMRESGRRILADSSPARGSSNRSHPQVLMDFLDSEESLRILLVLKVLMNLSERKPFFLIRRSLLLLLIRNASHQYQ